MLLLEGGRGGHPPRGRAQHYTLDPSSDEHRMVEPFLPLDSGIQGEEVLKLGYSCLKASIGLSLAAFWAGK